jgi:hypothetical protein
VIIIVSDLEIVLLSTAFYIGEAVIVAIESKSTALFNFKGEISYALVFTEGGLCEKFCKLWCL